MPIWPVTIFILVAAFALELGLWALYLSRSSDAYKIYAMRSKDYAKMLAVVVPNSLLSGGVVVATIHFAQPWIVHAGEAGVVDVIADVLVTMGLYDLLYYALHRFAFHEWKLLRKAHVLHHTVKYPTALESLFVHPVENLLGVALMMACMLVAGPVSIWAFALNLALFSWLNVVIHSGLDFRHPLLRPIAHLVRKHARHHSGMQAGNYASISPLPDLLFGTNDPA